MANDDTTNSNPLLVEPEDWAGRDELTHLAHTLRMLFTEHGRDKDQIARWVAEHDEEVQAPMATRALIGIYQGENDDEISAALEGMF